MSIGGSGVHTMRAFGILLALAVSWSSSAFAQPTLQIIEPAPGGCFNNGGELFEGGVLGGEALPDKRGIPLRLQLGSVSGDAVHLVYRVGEVVVGEADFLPGAANTPEESDQFEVPGFAIEDAANFELTVIAQADNQEVTRSVSFRLDREPPLAVVDLADLEAIQGCQMGIPNLAISFEDAQDGAPQVQTADSQEGCNLIRTYTATDNCGNAQAVRFAVPTAPDPGDVTVEVTGYLCGLDECVTGEDGETFADGARIGRGTVEYEVTAPEGCVDEVRANLAVDGGEPFVLIPGNAIEEAGEYAASVVVSACGQEQASADIGFTVLERPLCDAGDGYEAAQGQPLTLDASGSFAPAELGGIIEYAWDLNNDGFFDADEGRAVETMFDTAQGNGTYQVWLRITSANGGVDFCNTEVVVTDVDPTCEVALAEMGPFQEGDAVTFTSDGSAPGHASDPISHYEWDFGDGRHPQVAEGLVEATHIFEDAGDFTVTVRVHDADSFCEATTELVVGDCDPIVEGAAALGAGNLLEGLPVSFTAGETRPCNGFDGIDAFIWTFEPNMQPVEGPGLRNPQHTYADDGEYEVCLRVLDEDGDAEGCFMISVADLEPSAEFSGPRLVGEGHEACFDATNSVAGGAADPLDRLVWDFGDGTDPVERAPGDPRAICHTFAGSGDFEVTLTVHDEDSNTQFVHTVTVTDVEPTPRAAAVFPPEQQLAEEGVPLRFDASASTPGADSDPIVGYRWEFGDGEVSETEAPETQHAFADNGTYAVRVTVIDSDGSEAATTFAIEVRNVAPRVEIEFDGELDADGNPTLEIGAEATFRLLVDDVEADIPLEYIHWDLGNGGTIDNRSEVTEIYGELGEVTVCVEADDWDGDCAPIEAPGADQCQGNPDQRPAACNCREDNGRGDRCVARRDGGGEDPICHVVGSSDTACVSFVVTPAAPRIQPVEVAEVCEGQVVQFDLQVTSARRGQDEDGNPLYDDAVIGFGTRPEGMSCEIGPGEDPANQQEVSCRWLPTFFDAGEHRVRVTAVGAFTGVSRSRDIDFTVRNCGQPLLAGIGGTGSKLVRLYSYDREAGRIVFRPTSEVVLPFAATSIAAGPDGRYLFATVPSAGGVAVVSTFGRPQLLRMIPTGINPTAVVGGQVDGDPWLFVVNGGEDTLSVVDPRTLKVESKINLNPLRGAYDAAWVAPNADAGVERPRLAISSRRSSEVALVDPAAALAGENGVLASAPFPGPVVRLTYDRSSGWLAAADGKARVVHQFSAADLEADPGDLNAVERRVNFVPRDMFSRDGQVYVVTDTSLWTIDGAGRTSECESVRASAITALPESSLPGGTFVTSEGDRVENYVGQEDAQCPGRREIGTASPRMRRLVTFVGME